MAQTVREVRGSRLPAPPVYRDTAPGYVTADELTAVFGELERRKDKFGAQHLTLFDWASILGEEYGEACRAVNDAHFFARDKTAALDDVHRELIHVAAVALHAANIVSMAMRDQAQGCERG